MNKLRMTSLTALCAFLSGCVPIYVPNTVDAPLLRNADQVRLAANAGLTGLDVQSAVAVTDAIGIMANASFGSKSWEDSLSYNIHHYFEGAAGYYLPLSSLTTFEMYAGAGTGKSISSDTWNNKPSGQVRATGWYNRYFLQMDFGANTKIVGGGFAMRASYVHFIKIDAENGREYRNVDAYFAEPTLFASFGSPYVRFTGQMGLSWPIVNRPEFDWQPFVINFGISVNLGGK